MKRGKSNNLVLVNVLKKEYGENVEIISRKAVSGGEISSAYELELSNGNRIFLKQNSEAKADLFRAEEEGLTAMRKTNSVSVPRVIARGADRNGAFLLMEKIELGRGGKESSERLGRELALMHMADSSQFTPGGKYGFISDTYIGKIAQINSPKEKWVDFFAECRLRPQMNMAANYFGTEDMKKFDMLLAKLGTYLPEPEKPSLLHGDLWAGNYLIDTKGKPWLIDPATYVGHAEADLAMTELFGGFDEYFYGAYRETAGIDKGYAERRDLYNLYNLLNHLNHFGTGYLGAVTNSLKKYI